MVGNELIDAHKLMIIDNKKAPKRFLLIQLKK